MGYQPRLAPTKVPHSDILYMIYWVFLKPISIVPHISQVSRMKFLEVINQSNRDELMRLQ